MELYVFEWFYLLFFFILVAIYLTSFHSIKILKWSKHLNINSEIFTSTYWFCSTENFLPVYFLYFLRLSKIWSIIYHGSLEQVQSIECNFMFTCAYLAFFFNYFLFLVLLSYPRNNINHWETRIDNKKLPVEVYVLSKFVSIVWPTLNLKL